jgi:hypothetical protein
MIPEVSMTAVLAWWTERISRFLPAEDLPFVDEVSLRAGRRSLLKSVGMTVTPES